MSRKTFASIKKKNQWEIEEHATTELKKGEENTKKRVLILNRFVGVKKHIHFKVRLWTAEASHRFYSTERARTQQRERVRSNTNNTYMGLRRSKYSNNWTQTDTQKPFDTSFLRIRVDISKSFFLSPLSIVEISNER